jgi:type VII secretion-associated serine protease mycosin
LARGWRVIVTAVVVCVAIAWPGAASAEPIRALQWHLGYLRIPDAQRVTTGEGVTVAVIDSGVDATNIDLSGQVVSGACASNPGPGGDQDPAEDFDGHGTGMAGIIAAKGGDDGHALGISPGVRVMPFCVDATNIDQYVDEQEIAQGIIYASDHGASVISISLGATRPTSIGLQRAVGYALAHNVVVVAAGGNVSQGATSVADVARIPGVVAVTGMTRTGTFWSGSAQGSEAGIAAPAVDITSTDSTQKTDKPNTSAYATGSGTSGAAAIVSGVVALIRAKYPTLDAVNVINRLVKTADDKGAPGRDPQYGYGVVDPVRALTADVPKVGVNPLGTPPAPVSASHSTAAGQAAGKGDGGEGFGWLAALVGGLLLLVLVGGVVLVVVVGRRRRAVGG